MKLLIILCFCAVSVLGKVDFTTDELSQYFEQCLNEMVDVKSEELTDRQKACVTACMDKKLGVMTEDGKLVKERVLDFAKNEEEKTDMSRKYEKGMEKCKEFEGVDPCQLAECFYQEVILVH